jgi:nucleoside-diphosphate-sugar epimerase
VLPIDGDEPHDVVNVDWVSNAMVRLIKNPAARNRVFHVTASQPTTIRQVSITVANTTTARMWCMQVGMQVAMQLRILRFGISHGASLSWLRTIGSTV